MVYKLENREKTAWFAPYAKTILNNYINKGHTDAFSIVTWAISDPNIIGEIKKTNNFKYWSVSSMMEVIPSYLTDEKPDKSYVMFAHEAEHGLQNCIRGVVDASDSKKEFSAYMLAYYIDERPYKPSLYFNQFADNFGIK